MNNATYSSFYTNLSLLEKTFFDKYVFIVKFRIETFC